MAVSLQSSPLIHGRHPDPISTETRCPEMLGFATGRAGSLEERAKLGEDNRSVSRRYAGASVTKPGGLKR